MLLYVVFVFFWPFRYDLLGKLYSGTVSWVSVMICGTLIVRPLIFDFYWSTSWNFIGVPCCPLANSNPFHRPSASSYNRNGTHFLHRWITLNPCLWSHLSSVRQCSNEMRSCRWWLCLFFLIRSENARLVICFFRVRSDTINNIVNDLPQECFCVCCCFNHSFWTNFSPVRLHGYTFWPLVFNDTLGAFALVSTLSISFPGPSDLYFQRGLYSTPAPIPFSSIIRHGMITRSLLVRSFLIHFLEKASLRVGHLLSMDIL